MERPRFGGMGRFHGSFCFVGRVRFDLNGFIHGSVGFAVRTLVVLFATIDREAGKDTRSAIALFAREADCVGIKRQAALRLAVIRRIRNVIHDAAE